MTERFWLFIAGLYDEDGQGVTEYALVLAFVAILLAGILAILAGGITSFIKIVNSDLASLPGWP